MPRLTQHQVDTMISGILQRQRQARAISDAIAQDRKRRQRQRDGFPLAVYIMDRLDEEEETT